MPHTSHQLKGLLAATLLSAAALMPVGAAVAAPDVTHFADQLGYKLTVVPNATQDGFNTRLDLTLPKSGAPTAPWSLYFGSVSPVEPVGDSVFDLTHINGDNYKLTPKAGAALTPGKTYSLTWAGHAPSEYLAMPNAYIVADGAPPATIAASRTKFDPETGLESLPFVA